MSSSIMSELPSTIKLNGTRKNNKQIIAIFYFWEHITDKI